MRHYLLSKGDLPKYIDSLLGLGFRVIAPKMEGGSLVYGYLSSGSEFRDAVPAFFNKPFMGRENIFSLKDEFPSTIYFTRSCEVAAVAMLDDVRLRGPFADAIYLRKRKSIKLINIACTHSCSSKAFCASLQGPRLESGYSMQLTDVGDKYFVEMNDDLPIDYMVPADKEWLSKAINAVRGVYEEQSRVSMNYELKWSDSIWSELANKCIECGACTLACPTCFCYSMDYRDWSRQEDSCLWAGFTRMAGGNPRQSLDSRMRQRFYHKLSYHKDRYGYALCTGCGRCTTACPVDIDIRNVINHFSRGD
ncbi:MAG: 4Fe-4S dicluster domain-containing protein [Thermocladium sp.]